MRRAERPAAMTIEKDEVVRLLCTTETREEIDPLVGKMDVPGPARFRQRHEDHAGNQIDVGYPDSAEL